MTISLKAAPPLPRYRERTPVEAFHELYYDREAKSTWQDTHWLGVTVFKCPLDLWIYQEIIAEQRPDVIVECGTFKGGSALFLASLCDLLGKGRVLTIDLDAPDGKPRHPRITYLQGSSTAPETVARVHGLIGAEERVLVILDSDHHCDHVLSELRLYSPLVPPGGYLIVEDTNVNGHPVADDFGPGPMEAVEAFLRENSSFVVDETREKFLMTFNPRGYLKRIR